MSTAAERRRQKAIEKAKKRRDEARTQRADRRARAPDLPDSLGPLVGAYVSSNWADRGVQVRAAVARPDATGRLVAALITADLASGALTVAIEPRVPAAGWDARVSAHGGDLVMIEVDPALVASLVQAVHAFGGAHTDPDGLGAVNRLLSGVRAADHPHGWALGLEPEQPAPAGWTERIAAWFSRR